MKQKIGLTLILGIIITTIIYFNIDKDTLNFLALGDGISTGMTAYHIEGYDFNDYLTEYLNENNNLEHYYKTFNETDESVTSLLNKINNNVESLERKIKIKQAIKQADIITIALGMDELNNYVLKNNLGSTKINGYLNKFSELLKILRNLNNKKIFVIGLYSSTHINKKTVEKINTELERLVKKEQAEFINISEITENSNFFPVKNNYYLNYKGQEYIYNKIKEKLEKNLPTSKII